MVGLTAGAVLIVATAGTATPVLLGSAQVGLAAGGTAIGAGTAVGATTATTVAASMAAGGAAGTITASEAGSTAVTLTGIINLLIISLNLSRKFFLFI